jgi:DNA-binding winged helix-turn-helix (wHTH) protein
MSTPGAPHSPSIDAVAGWQLGPVSVDVANLQILTGKRVLTNETSQVYVLLALIEAWPDILDKDQLIERAWPNRLVSDSAVHKSISLLRRSLAAGGLEPSIETRHRLGYRLAVEPVPLVAPAFSSRTEDFLRPARKPRRAWLGSGLGLAVLLMLVGLFWYAGLRETGQLTAETGFDAARADVEPGLAELEIERLLELARRSTPNDLAMAEQALTAADQQLTADTSANTAGLLAKQWGIVDFYQGRDASAIEHWQRALALLERAGNRPETANVLSNLGAVHEQSGADDAETEALFQRALGLFVELDDLAGQARTLNNAIEFLLRRNRLATARIQIDQLKELADTMDSGSWRARAALHEGDWAARMPGIDPLPAYQSAHDRFRADGDLVSAATVAQRIARVFDERDRLDDGLNWLESAYRHLESAGLLARLPLIDYAIAGNHERRGEPALARIHYQAVIDGLAPDQMIDLRIDAEINLARLDVNQGSLAAAERRLQGALRLARINDRPGAEASALMARGFASLLNEDGAAVAIDSARAARERLGADHLSWSHERNLLALEALAQTADGRFADAESTARLLRQRALENDDLHTLKQADFADAARLFAEGRFAQAYRHYRGAIEHPAPPSAARTRQAAPPAIESPARIPLALSLPLVLALGVGVGWLAGRRRVAH